MPKEVSKENCGNSCIQRIELLQDAELSYIKSFIRESSFDDDLPRSQLCCLWTAYCFHNDLIVDTAAYDNTLQELWSFMVNCALPLSLWWPQFEDFDNFMCAYLV